MVVAMSELLGSVRPCTFVEARRCGWSRRRLRDAVRDGRVRRLLRGVYVAGWVEDNTELRVAAVARIARPQEVVCDRTAAWLHGIDAFGYDAQEVLPVVETCVRRGSAPIRRSDIDGRTRDLRDEDVMTLFGMEVTTPLRTALDLGCALPRHRALGTLDAFMHDHAITHSDMMRTVPRYFRRRGVVQLRSLVPLADSRAESMRESWLRLDIRDAGLPVPEVQYWIEVDGVPRYRLDLAYPAHRVAVEYDGEEYHRRTEEQRENDRKRRAWLLAHGWTVIVVDKDGLCDESPDSWLARLAEALRPQTKRLRWTRTAI